MTVLAPLIKEGLIPCCNNMGHFVIQDDRTDKSTDKRDCSLYISDSSITRLWFDGIKNVQFLYFVNLCIVYM